MWPFHTSNAAALGRDALAADPSVRGSALEALRRLAERRPARRGDAIAAARAYLAGRLSAETDPWPAVAAARLLQALGTQAEARRTWDALLAHPDAGVAAQAALALERVPDPAAYVPALLRALAEHPDVRVRTAALRTLGRIRDPRGFPALCSCLTDPDPETRAHAVEALGEFGDPRAIPALEALGGDPAEAWPEPNPHFPRVTIADRVADVVRRLGSRGTA